MVEPHRDEKPTTTKKEGVLKAEEVMDRLKLWITPKTIEYIDKQVAAEPSTSNASENISKNGEEEVSASQVIEQYYSGILDPREYEKKKSKEEDLKSVNLSLVDSIDPHFRRVDIVLSGLKKAWISYVNQLKIGYPVNNVKNLISTFALDKSNCVIDPKSSDYFATAILQIMSHCSNDLKELLHRQETFEYHQRYHELLQIDFDFFETKLAELLAEKRQELGGQANEGRQTNQKRWKNQKTSLNKKNSSTLSLHIQAYDDCTEGISNETLTMKSKFINVDKALAKMKLNQDTIEFPRQTYDAEPKTTALEMFTAPQQLFHPKQDCVDAYTMELPNSIFAIMCTVIFSVAKNLGPFWYPLIFEFTSIALVYFKVSYKTSESNLWMINPLIVVIGAACCFGWESHYIQVPNNQRPPRAYFAGIVGIFLILINGLKYLDGNYKVCDGSDKLLVIYWTGFVAFCLSAGLYCFLKYKERQTTLYLTKNDLSPAVQQRIPVGITNILISLQSSASDV